MDSIEVDQVIEAAMHTRNVYAKQKQRFKKQP
jgi:hypothetical protein